MLYCGKLDFRRIAFAIIATTLVGIGTNARVSVAEPTQFDGFSRHSPALLDIEPPSYPFTSILSLFLQDLNELAVMQRQPQQEPEQAPQRPPYTITETETEVIIKFCTANPESPEREICTTITINKLTGKSTIVITGYIFLPLTFEIVCQPNGVCIFKDMLFTKFCKIKKDPDGKVVYDCDFNYLNVSFKGKIFIYVEDGKICVQNQKPDGALSAPECAPIDSIPSDLQELIRRLNLPYLPALPPPTPPCTKPSNGEGSGEPGPDMYPETCNPYPNVL